MRKKGAYSTHRAAVAHGNGPGYIPGTTAQSLHHAHGRGPVAGGSALCYRGVADARARSRPTSRLKRPVIIELN